jgi:energy-coupling factor transporter ATP-binding protein EcfA2
VEDLELLKLVERTLLSEYPTSTDLHLALRLAFGSEFLAVLPTDVPMAEFVSRLVEISAERGEIKELSEAVIRDRVDSPAVQELRRALKREQDPIEEMQRLIAEGRCVLFVGAGVSNYSGMPTWADLIRALIGRASADGLLEPALREELTGVAAQGDLDYAAERIQSHLGIEKMRDYLNQEIAWNAAPHEIHRNLAALPFTAAVTTNWDRLLESAFAQRAPPVLTWDNSAHASQLLDDLKFFIFKLSGDLTRPQSIVLNRRILDGTLAQDEALRRFLRKLLATRTVVFIGSSPETMEVVLRAGAQNVRDARHFAFVGTNFTPGWEKRSAFLSRYFGLSLIPYSSGTALAGLVQRLKPGHLESSTLTSPPRLRRASFQNIGPFDSVEIQFSDGWNILLGDNGLGKSSILRALAVAMCGESAEPWADRLIKFGRPTATITVETTHFTHRISLLRRRNGPGADYGCVPPTPMAPLPIIGFPPLRAATAGPLATKWEASGAPTTEDLLPLVTGGPDWRIEELKQWVINLDHRIKSAVVEGRDPAPHQKLLDDFFRVLARITDGIPISFGKVDAESRQVTVLTADGEVPIDMLSQGTVSLISWVGLVVQRLYEIRGSTDPLLRHALVLIDEIDAHMHPRWQQAIVHQLKDLFPNVQFVATAHSPLLVTGRSAEEVTIFSREGDTGKILARQATVGFSGMRADQVLTSQAFNLKAARDYETSLKLAEYRSLLEKSALSSQDERRLSELRSDPSILDRPSAQTPLAADAYATLSQSIDTVLAAKSPDEANRLRKEIDVQLREARLEREKR